MEDSSRLEINEWQQRILPPSVSFRSITLVPPVVIHLYALFSRVQDFVRLQAQFSIEVWK